MATLAVTALAHVLTRNQGATTICQCLTSQTIDTFAFCRSRFWKKEKRQLDHDALCLGHNLAKAPQDGKMPKVKISCPITPKSRMGICNRVASSNQELFTRTESSEPVMFGCPRVLLWASSAVPPGT